jgi:hypothetical protein
MIPGDAIRCCVATESGHGRIPPKTNAIHGSQHKTYEHPSGASTSERFIWMIQALHMKFGGRFAHYSCLLLLLIPHSLFQGTCDMVLAQAEGTGSIYLRFTNRPLWLSDVKKSLPAFSSHDHIAPAMRFEGHGVLLHCDWQVAFANRGFRLVAIT